MAAARAIHYLSSITDRQPAQLKSVDPCEVLRALRPLLAHLVGDSVALEISCADHVWPIKANLEDLELIISSLSANARDAMPDGGKLRWSVTNVAVSEDHVAYAHGIPIGNYVLIGVADTGCGISPDLIDRIFEPFFSTKSGRGNGTGLSLVYRAILGMQGHILVRSESNSGSKFELFLPSVPISK
jgi:signal transduction histidine kinase